MPSQNNGSIVNEDWKTKRAIFFVNTDFDNEGVFSPTDSNSTDYLEDNVTPPIITPNDSNTSNTVSTTSLQASTSDDDFIIPLYLFHLIERTSLNIEFNRCLQISLLHENPQFKTNEDEDQGVVIDESCSEITFSSSSYSSQVTEYDPELIMELFPQYIFWNEEYDDNRDDLIPDWIFNMPAENENDPEWIIELFPRNIFWNDEYDDEDDDLFPEWMFSELEDNEILIPPYLFFEDEHDNDNMVIPPYLFDDPHNDIKVADVLAGGDFNVIEDKVETS